MTTPSLATYKLPMQRDVALFHDSFGMPNLIATPGPLPLHRIELRIGLIREEGIAELSEAIEQNDDVAIIDALIDTIYVSLGALVEMGEIAINSLVTENDTLGHKVELAITARTSLKYTRQYLPRLEAAFRAQNAAQSVEILHVITRGAVRALLQADVDPQPFFDEVQRANMSKLGADGKAIHSRGMELDGYPEGKTLKGPNYSPPDLAAIYARLYPERIKEATPLVSAEFRRGASAAAESMRFYFLDENEGAIYDVSTTDLRSFEESAVAQTLRDEQRRIELGRPVI
jgi:hypothetical protein